MSVTRRGFLRGLGSVFAAIPAVKLLPLLPAVAAPPVGLSPIVTPMTTYLVGEEALISAEVGQYADWISFSDLALSASLTPEVEHLSKELGHRLGYTINLLAAEPPKMKLTFPNHRVRIRKEATFS